MLVSAIEEERLNRRKHCAGFPVLSARAALEQAGVRPADIEDVAISRDPRARLGQKVLFALQRPGFAGRCATALANLGKAARRRRRAPRSARGRRPLRAAVPRGRPPPLAHRERVLRVAVRGGRVPLHGRLRRLRLRDAGGRARPVAEPHRRGRVPALARALLHRRHPVPRVPQVRRGVEDDGARAVREAPLRREAPEPDPPRAGREVRARHLLLPPLLRRHRDVLGEGGPHSAASGRTSSSSCSGRRATRRTPTSTGSGRTSRRRPGRLRGRSTSTC